MASLVSDIMSLNKEDMNMLAQALAWYSTGVSDNKAKTLEFLLQNHIREQDAMDQRFKEAL